MIKRTQKHKTQKKFFKNSDKSKNESTTHQNMLQNQHSIERDL